MGSQCIEIHSALKSLTGDQLCALYENRIKSIYGDDDRIDFTGITQLLTKKCWVGALALPQDRDEK